MPRGLDRARRDRDDDVRVQAYQLRGQCGKAVILSFGPSALEYQVLAFYEAELPQCLTKFSTGRIERWQRARVENPNAVHPAGLLGRSGDEWPRGQRRASGQK
jgi:hypothetical protein